jgi:uncharacterized protein
MKTEVRTILLFFFAVVAISWLAWVPAAAARLSGEESMFAPTGLIGGLARWSPGIVAVLLAAWMGGKAGARALFASLKRWRVGPGWYLFALFFQAGLFLIARWVDSLRGIAPEVVSPLISVYGTEMAVVMAPVVILTAFPGALAEELGWRGFALPRLQAKISPLAASLVIALVWGVWHIPLLIYFAELQAADFTAMLVAVLNFIPLTILYTWLYHHTRGSLLLVTLFHLGQQFSNNFLGTWPTLTDEMVMWACALAVVTSAYRWWLCQAAEQREAQPV